MLIKNLDRKVSMLSLNPTLDDYERAILATRRNFVAIRGDEMNRTPWFPGSVKPTRAGFYERKFNSSADLAYWNGSVWEYAPFALESLEQDSPWRGVEKSASSKSC
jgi:hypothetical protein